MMLIVEATVLERVMHGTSYNRGMGWSQRELSGYTIEHQKRIVRFAYKWSGVYVTDIA